jgi:hypothetical protein
MKGADRFTGARLGRGIGHAASDRAQRRAWPEPGVEGQIDDRRREQGQQLADQQAAEDGDAQRTAQLGALAPAQHQRHGGEQRGQRRHQDRAEAQQAAWWIASRGALALVALGVDGEVDHHDRVLLHDADQQDDADDADHAQVVAGQHQGQQRADAGRRQGRQDGQRVHVALVQHAQHDVDADHRRQDQPQLVGQRVLIGAGRAEEGAADTLAGMPISTRPADGSTARPSETPGAVSKPMVVAGNCATWVTCSGAGLLA